MYTRPDYLTAIRELTEELGLLLAVGVGLLVGPISASVFYAHHAHYYRRIQ